MFAPSHFWPLMIALAASCLGAAAVAGANAPLASDVTAAAAQHGAGATDPAHAGIWKAVSPPRGSMHGEFANNDPFGVSVGVKIEADCSLNWVDPDSGKLYCFSTATSLIFFLDAPHTYLARARRNWPRLSRAQP